MLTKNNHDRLSCKVPKLHNGFLITRDDLFLRLNRLSKQMERIRESSSKMQELCALNQLNPQAALAQLARLRISLSTTSPKITLMSTKEIAKAFGRLVASSITTYSNLTNPCPTCPNLKHSQQFPSYLKK